MTKPTANCSIEPSPPRPNSANKPESTISPLPLHQSTWKLHWIANFFFTCLPKKQKERLFGWPARKITLVSKWGCEMESKKLQPKLLACYATQICTNIQPGHQLAPISILYLAIFNLCVCVFKQDYYCCICAIATATLCVGQLPSCRQLLDEFVSFHISRTYAFPLCTCMHTPGPLATFPALCWSPADPPHQHPQSSPAALSMPTPQFGSPPPAQESTFSLFRQCRGTRSLFLQCIFYFYASQSHGLSTPFTLRSWHLSRLDRRHFWRVLWPCISDTGHQCPSRQ